MCEEIFTDHWLTVIQLLPFHCACESGDVTLVQWFIDQELSFADHTADSGASRSHPMHIAVECGQLEVVKLLCQHDPKQLRLQDTVGVSQESFKS